MKKKKTILFIIEILVLYTAYFVLLFLTHKYLRGLSIISTGYDERFWIAYQVPMFEKMLVTAVSIVFACIFSKILTPMNFAKPALINILSGTLLILIIVIYTLCFVFCLLPIFSIHAFTAIQSMTVGGVLQIANGIRMRRSTK